MRKNKVITQIIGLGIISGMRSTFAPAIAAHYLSKNQNVNLAQSKLRFIQSATTAVVTKLFSLGEITGDKLPSTPDRIIIPSVIARSVSGAFAGAVITTANKENVAKGILIGGAAAFAATFATFYLRRYLDKSSPIKEPVTGVLEDALAIGSGILLMQ